MTSTPRSIETLHSRATTYEVAMITGEATTVVGYTAKRTKSALLGFARANAQFILDNLASGDDPEPLYTRARGWTFGPVRVAFTGRTEREAATHAQRDRDFAERDVRLADGASPQP